MVWIEGVRKFKFSTTSAFYLTSSISMKHIYNHERNDDLESNVGKNVYGSMDHMTLISQSTLTSSSPSTLVQHNSKQQQKL